VRVLCRALAVLLLRNLRTQAAHGLFGLKPGSIAFPDSCARCFGRSQPDTAKPVKLDFLFAFDAKGL